VHNKAAVRTLVISGRVLSIHGVDCLLTER